MSDFRPPTSPDLTASGFHRLRKSLFADTIVYTLVRAGTGVGSLLLLVVLAHALAPADLGTFSLVANAAALVAIAWYGWLGSASNRFSPSYRAAGRLSEMRALIIRAYSGLSAALIVVLVALRFAGLGEVTSLAPGLFAAALVLTVSLGPAQSLVELYRIDGARSEYVRGALLLTLGPLLAIIVATWLTDVTVAIVVWAQALIAAAIFAFIGLGWIGGRYMSGREITRALRRFAAYGIPFVGGLVCSWVLSVADRYLIAAIEGSHDVGTYTAGYQLATAPLAFLYSAAIAPVEPLSYSAHEGGDTDRAGAILAKTFCLFLMVSTLSVMLLAVLRADLARWVLGPPYVPSADVIPLAALGASLMFLALMRQQVLILMHKTRVAFLNLLVCAGANILLNIVLIPSYGIVGAAAASAASYALLLVAAAITSRSRYPFPLPPRWLISWVAAMVAGLAAVSAIHLIMEPSLARSVTDTVVVATVYIGVLIASSGGELVAFFTNLRRAPHVSETPFDEQARLRPPPGA